MYSGIRVYSPEGKLLRTEEMQLSDGTGTSGKMVEHNCPICERRTKRKKYCSPHCARTANLKKMGSRRAARRASTQPKSKHKCELFSCQVMTTRPKFCSNKCSLAIHRHYGKVGGRENLARQNNK